MPLRRLLMLALLAFGVAYAVFPSASTGGSPSTTVSVVYRSGADLAAALRRTSAREVRVVPQLRVAELRLDRDRLAALRGPGIAHVHALVPRAEAGDVAPPAFASPASEWQLQAVDERSIPMSILAAARSVTIAVIDTGADVGAPAIAAKHPLTYDVRTHGAAVADRNGHGTFVASIAAGGVTANLGMEGSGGDARLLVVRAAGPSGKISDVDEAAAIVYAIRHGARILNLSFAGLSTSPTERRAIRYAVSHGALVVAPVGNESADGNPVEYPAALLQPVGSNGSGGVGLAVAASTSAGERAPFSNTGSTVSLAAPGVGVFGAVSRSSSPRRYPRTPAAAAGLYGYASGTSFSVPLVAGAAALVWAANPLLTAQEVAAILKQTASGGGEWTDELGFGVIDVGAAVAAARQSTSTLPG